MAESRVEAIVLQNTGSEALSFQFAVQDGWFTVGQEAMSLGVGALGRLSVQFEAPDDLALAQADLSIEVAGLDGVYVGLAGRAESDGDGDGSLVSALGGDDCDDEDAQIFPGAPEVDNLLDDDCDGSVDEDFVEFGDLVFTELWVGGASEEEPPAWMEVRNVSDRSLRVASATLWYRNLPLALALDMVLDPGAHAVLCSSSAVLALGVGCDDHLNGQLELSIYGGELAWSLGGTVLDTLAWEEDWGLEADASWSLDPGLQDAEANDLSGSWCVAESTAGTVNDLCAFR